MQQVCPLRSVEMQTANPNTVFTDIRPEMKIVSVHEYVMRRYQISFHSPGERRGVAELKTSPRNILTSQRRFLGPYFQSESSIPSKKPSTSPMILLMGLLRAFTPVVTLLPAFYLGLTIILIADQAQCHRVSSALEAGTVRHP